MFTRSRILKTIALCDGLVRELAFVQDGKTKYYGVPRRLGDYLVTPKYLVEHDQSKSLHFVFGVDFDSIL